MPPLSRRTASPTLLALFAGVLAGLGAIALSPAIAIGIGVFVAVWWLTSKALEVAITVVTLTVAAAGAVITAVIIAGIGSVLLPPPPPKNPEVVANINDIQIPEIIRRANMLTFHDRASDPDFLVQSGAYVWLAATRRHEDGSDTAVRRLHRYKVGEGGTGLEVYTDFEPGPYLAVANGTLYVRGPQGATSAVFEVSGPPSGVTEVPDTGGDVQGLVADGSNFVLLRRNGQDLKLTRHPSGDLLHEENITGLAGAANLTNLGGGLFAFTHSTATQWVLAVWKNGGAHFTSDKVNGQPVVMAALGGGIVCCAAGATPETHWVDLADAIPKREEIDSAKGMSYLVRNGDDLYLQGSSTPGFGFVKAGAYSESNANALTTPPATVAGSTVLGATVYVVGVDGMGKTGLWKVADTYERKDLGSPATDLTLPTAPTAYDGRVVFAAKKTTNEWYLVASAGTAATTSLTLIEDIVDSPPPARFFDASTNSKTELLFRAAHRDYNVEPFRWY